MPAEKYNPNLGVLSAFQGMGEAATDIGRMGMVDAMETRRSKMEHELRRQLKGEDQEFSVEQADVKDERDVEAATVAHGRKLKEIEATGKAKAAATNKELANKEMLAPDRKTPVSMDNVRKLYADANGLNQDLIEWDKVEPDFNKWAASQGYTWRNAPPVEPPPAIDESTYRERYKQHVPDASPEEIDAAVKKNRSAGKISGAASVPAAEPGVMDAMAADAGAGTGEFAGGAPQGAPAAAPAAAPVEPVKPVVPAEVDTKAAAIAGVSADDANKMVNKKNLQSKLLQYKAVEPVESVKRRSTRTQARNESKKIQKAAKQVEAALKKGNINTISKDRLKLALKNQLFVGNLSEEELQTLIDYLEQ